MADESYEISVNVYKVTPRESSQMPSRENVASFSIESAYDSDIFDLYRAIIACHLSNWGWTVTPPKDAEPEPGEAS